MLCLYSVVNGVRRLDVNKALTRWKHHGDEIPSSVCSEPCPTGHVRKVKGVQHCCWVCIQCREYEIIIDDEQRCLPCPNGTFPTSLPARNVCEPLPVDYMSIDSSWAVFPVVFSVIGIVPVTFIPELRSLEACSRIPAIDAGVIGGLLHWSGPCIIQNKHAVNKEVLY